MFQYGGGITFRHISHDMLKDTKFNLSGINTKINNLTGTYLFYLALSSFFYNIYLKVMHIVSKTF